MSPRASLKRSGPDLPYDLVTGVVACPGGWLVASAKVQGSTLAPQQPEVFKKFIDILDYRPAYASIALALPLGLPSKRARGGRSCDRDARALLGWPRSGAIAPPPIWNDVDAWKAGGDKREGLSAVTRSLMPRIAEVYEHLGSYHQRTLFEVHPELSFYQINKDHPLQHSKRSEAGTEERHTLLLNRIPGIERVLTMRLPRVRGSHLVDAAACLWTARRILARAVVRLPEDAEWDERGFRMELVR